MDQAGGLRLRFVVSAFVSFFVAASVGAESAQAGGGPENLFLVVNARSQNSLTIANQYIQLRHVPPGNVYYLDWDGPPDTTDIETFREKILGPVLQAVSTRGIANQIDYVVYSSDFPTRIDFAGDLPEHEQNLIWATQGAPVADLFNQKVEGTAWKSKPSWYIVATKDHTIQPELERFVAKRMGATTFETDSSHVPMLSQPDFVLDVIRKAATAVMEKSESQKRSIA